MEKIPYKPIPVVDTAGLTREEWLEYRKHGIGASDLPILMEVSEYKSVLGLFQEKVSRKPIKELEQKVLYRLKLEQAEISHAKSHIEPDIFSDSKLGEPIIDFATGFNLSAEVGRALEPVIGRYLSCRLGLPVFKDTILYLHPHYPFLMVNLDFVMLMPDPETGELCHLVIVECKTATFWKKEDWGEGVPYGYELQCRQAMCVMNVNEVLIICLFDNNEGGVVTYRITRDYIIEAEIIQKAKTFWEGNVEKEILPIPVIPTKAAKRELALYAKQQEKHKPLPQLFERGLAELIRQFTDVQKLVDHQKQEYDASKEELETIQLKLSTYMLHHDEAVCGDVKLRWKEKSSRRVDYDGFKLAYPLLYAKFVSESVTLSFEAKLKKTTKQKEAA